MKSMNDVVRLFYCRKFFFPYPPCFISSIYSVKRCLATGSPWLTTMMGPGISIVNHDGNRSRHPCDQPHFMIFFAVVAKNTLVIECTLWSLSECYKSIHSYGCFLLETGWKGQFPAPKKIIHWSCDHGILQLALNGDLIANTQNAVMWSQGYVSHHWNSETES